MTDTLDVKIDVHPRDVTRMTIDAGYQSTARVKDIPGARYDRDLATWTIPLTWQAALEAGQLARGLRARVSPSKAMVEWVALVTDQAKMLGHMAVDTTANGHGPGLFAHQSSGARWLAADTPDFPGRMLLDETGCLAGDTMVTVNRAGKAARMRLDWVVEQFHGSDRTNPTHMWDLTIPTYVSRADGDVGRLGQLVEAWHSGVKTTYEVRTNRDRVIRATADHKFLTSDGWARLGDLRPGELVAVNHGKQRGDGPPSKPRYRYTYGMDAHPYRVVRNGPRPGKDGWAVAEHRLVAEAVVNNLDPTVFIEKVRAGEVHGLTFLDPAVMAVHHKDHNPLNNSWDNLAVMSHTAHKREHVDVNRVLDRIGLDQIVSITEHGEEKTYDLSMGDDPHNYLANGFVVHNSGKTRTVITALGDVDEWPVLVVCPNSVKDSWAAEFATVRPDLDVVVVRGSAAQRRKALLSKAHVYVTNYESVRTHSRLVAYPGQALTDAQKIEKPEELNRTWPVVVADEAHRMKNPKAKVTMAMWGVGRFAERRWALTGTPVANTPGDLWALLRWIDPQAWPVRTSWTDYYCETEIDWFGVMRVTGMKPEVNDTWVRGWRPVNRRVLKESVLDLPPLLRGGSLVRHVDLTPVQRTAYRQMAEEMVAAVRNGTVTVSNALVRTGRLMTLASAFAEVVGEEGAEEFRLALPSNKITAFMEDWKEGDFPGPTVVATHSRQLLSLLASTLREAGLGQEIAMIHGGIEESVRRGEIERFQKEEVPLFLMTFGVGGTGITLTAARRMVLLQRSWSAVDMKQAADRVHRIGSERHASVEIVDYLSPGTVEVGQMDRLLQKEGALQQVVRDADTLSRLLKGEAL